MADMGREISLKLTYAPPNAISITNDEIKNWVEADEVSAFSTSVRRAKMLSSFSTLASILAALSFKLVMLRSTCPRVWLAERQNGTHVLRILCRCWYEARYSATTFW